MPDYTRQLNEIVTALNRPSVPQWAYVILGAVLTLAIQFAVKWIDAFIKRRKLRKIVYLEIVHMYGTAQAVQSMKLEGATNEQYWQWQINELKTALKFRGEEYYNKNLDTFSDLSERYHIEHVYGRFHKILDDLPAYHENVGLATGAVARLFSENVLKQKYLKRWARPQAESLMAEMREMYADEQRRIKALER